MTIEEEIQIGRKYCLDRARGEMIYSYGNGRYHHWVLYDNRGLHMWKTNSGLIRLMIL